MGEGLQGGATLLLDAARYAAATVVIGGAGAYVTSTRWARRHAEGRGVHASTSAVLRRWALAGAAALVLIALIQVGMRAGAASGGVPSLNDMSRVVSGTMWGNGWWAQLYVALLAAAGLLIAGRRPRQGWSLATAAALGIAYTLPMTGDDGAAVLDRPAFALAALHVFGAGIWIGVPVLLVAARRSAPVSRDLAAAAAWTLGVGAAVAVGSGAILMGLELGGVSGLLTTGYGRVLLLKLGAAAAAGGLARSRPGLALLAGAAALLLAALL
jgi:putative copper export protein